MYQSTVCAGEGRGGEGRGVGGETVGVEVGEWEGRGSEEGRGEGM